MNAIILDYLKNYKDKYPLGSLKEKILSRGYSETEFNEALALLNNQTVQALQVSPKPTTQLPVMVKMQPESTPISKSTALPFTPKPIIFNHLERSEKKGSSKELSWVKTSGVIGIIILFLIILCVVGVFLKLDSGITYFLSTNQAFSYIFFGISLLLVLTYLYGFVNLGSLAKSQTLKTSSTLRILILVLFTGLYLFTILTLPPASQANTSGALSMGTLNALPPSTPGWTIIFFAILIFSWIVVGYIFSISLITLGRHVRYIKVAGILEMIITLIFTLTIGVMMYTFITQDLSIWSLFLYKEVYLSVTFISSIVFFLSLFFESLSLLSASKEYEE